MVSKTAEMIVEHSRALMYDAIHEQIKDLLNELKFSWGWKQGQVNKHKNLRWEIVCEYVGCITDML